MHFKDAQRNTSPAFRVAADERCWVCLITLVEPPRGIEWMPCGHACCCQPCANTVAELAAGCPVCRT